MPMPMHSHTAHHHRRVSINRLQWEFSFAVLPSYQCWLMKHSLSRAQTWPSVHTTAHQPAHITQHITICLLVVDGRPYCQRLNTGEPNEREIERKKKHTGSALHVRGLFIGIWLMPSSVRHHHAALLSSSGCFMLLINEFKNIWTNKNISGKHRRAQMVKRPKPASHNNKPWRRQWRRLHQQQQQQKPHTIINFITFSTWKLCVCAYLVLVISLTTKLNWNADCNVNLKLINWMLLFLTGARIHTNTEHRINSVCIFFSSIGWFAIFIFIRLSLWVTRKQCTSNFLKSRMEYKAKKKRSMINGAYSWSVSVASLRLPLWHARPCSNDVFVYVWDVCVCMNGNFLLKRLLLTALLLTETSATRHDKCCLARTNNILE